MGLNIWNSITKVLRNRKNSRKTHSIPHQRMTDIARLGKYIRSLNRELLSATKLRNSYCLSYQESGPDFLNLREDQSIFLVINERSEEKSQEC
jgi:hypothetical protein